MLAVNPAYDYQRNNFDMRVPRVTAQFYHLSSQLSHVSRDFLQPVKIATCENRRV